MRVRYSYLPQQFGDCEDLWRAQSFRLDRDFTLGKPLAEFERRFAHQLIGVKHAIGVNSGTDAIKLAQACGIGYGDEVITTANTFVATVGAICEIGANPVFVDCDDTFCMDVAQVERAITPRTDDRARALHRIPDRHAAPAARSPKAQLVVMKTPANRYSGASMAGTQEPGAAPERSRSIP